MPFTGAGSTYTHYKEYEIPGSAIDGAHTDFVAHFSRTDADLAAACRSDGNDIIFCDTSDNQLDHHLIYWDQGTGRIQARVRLTTVDATAFTLRVYYGKASQTTATQNIAGTYGSNYDGAWFFDGGSTVEDQIGDVNTDFTADGTPTFAWSDTWGVGASCDGGTDGYTAPDVAYSSTNQTVEIAINTSNVVSGTDWRFFTKQTSGTASDHDIMLGTAGTALRLRSRIQLGGSHGGTLLSTNDEWVNSQAQRMATTWATGSPSDWILYGEDAGAGFIEAQSTTDASGNSPSWTNSASLEVMQAGSTNFVNGVFHWLLISPVAFSYEYLLTQDLVVKANPLTVTTAEQTNAGGVSPDAFAVPVTFGSPSVSAGIVTPTAFSVPVAFGTPAVTANSIVAPSSFSVPVSFGSPSVSAGIATPPAFNVPVAFGTPTVAANLTALPPGFAVPVTFGAPSVTTTQDVAPAAFSVPVAFGTPNVTTGKIYALGTNAHGFSSGVSGSGTTTLAHTLVAGPNRIMRIVVAARSNSSAPVFNSVTYGGVTATLAETQDEAFGLVSIYYVLEADLPADGSNNIVLSRNFSSSTRVTLFGSLIADAAQVAPELTDPVSSSSAGTSIAANVTGVTDGAWVLGGFFSSDTTINPTWNNGQEEYFDDDGGFERLSGGELKGASGETSLSVSFSSSSLARGFIVASFAPLSDDLSVSPTAFSVPVAFGTPTVETGQNLAPSSFSVPVTFGSPVVGTNQNVTPPAFSVPVSFGTVDVRERTIPPSFSVPVVFGTPAVFTGATPPSFTVPVGFGTPVVTTPPIVEPASFSVPVTFGSPAVVAFAPSTPLNPDYFLVPIEFGVPVVAISGTVSPAALSVPVTFGVPTVVARGSIVAPTFPDKRTDVKSIRLRLPRKIRDWKTGPGEERQLKEQLSQLERAFGSIGTQIPKALKQSGALDTLAHAPTHILEGSDPIDADQLGVDYEPTNYSPALVTDIATSLMHLAAHLAGIDVALLNVEPHGDTHENGGADELNVQGLDGILFNSQKVTVRKNGGSGSALTAIDFIEGTNITITHDTTGGENNITIAASVGLHAPTHIRGGGDPIDGDLLDVDYIPTNYTRAATSPATHIEHLAAHLIGINAAFALKASTSHASTHITAGGDEIDGDRLDIDWNPTNYSPTTAPAEVTSLDHLVAHLAGIDDRLIHANTHTREGEDPIDGDLLDVDYVPVGYTRSPTSPFTNDEHLSAHLRGISLAFATKASTDGDVLHISWSPSNYTPTTAPSEVTNTNQLTAHLAGIDAKLLSNYAVISGSAAANSTAILTGTVTGARIGDGVIVCPVSDLPNDVQIRWARVDASDSVRVCIFNEDTDTATGTLSFHVSINKVTQTGV